MSLKNNKDSDSDTDIRQVKNISGIGQNKFNKILSLFLDPSLSNDKRTQILEEDVEKNKNTSVKSLENKSIQTKINLWQNKINKHSRQNSISLDELKHSRFEQKRLLPKTNPVINSNPEIKPEINSNPEIKPEINSNSEIKTKTKTKSKTKPKIKTVKKKKIVKKEETVDLQKKEKDLVEVKNPVKKEIKKEKKKIEYKSDSDSGFSL
jgi:hypothetical protein